jgi:hypothetical protein
VDGPFAETKELIAGYAIIEGKLKEPPAGPRQAETRRRVEVGAKG